MSKARQQRANVKARKAKARAEHEAKFGTWINRPKASHQKQIINPFSVSRLPLAALEALIDRMERSR